jgi:hypothetical protein
MVEAAFSRHCRANRLDVNPSTAVEASEGIEPPFKDLQSSA